MPENVTETVDVLILGAGPVVIAFFMAPFFGILIALYMLFFSKQREMP